MYRGKQWWNTLGGHEIHLKVLFGIVGRVGWCPREFFWQVGKTRSVIIWWGGSEIQIAPLIYDHERARCTNSPAAFFFGSTLLLAPWCCLCLSYPDTRNDFGEKNVFFLWSAGHRLLQVTVGSLCLSARDVQIHSSLTPGSWGLSTGRQEPKQTWKVSLWICGLGSTPCTLVHSGEHDMIMCLPYCKSHFSSLHY